jgi:hypothetical protein
MKDEEIEELLRAVRPVGPPPALRARIVAARPVRRAWPWVAAAAALLAVTVSLRVAATQTLDRVRPAASAAPAATASDLETLRDVHGLDDARARALALTRDLARRIRGEQEEAPPR